jgi:microtubule-associated protein, RP/EB family
MLKSGYFATRSELLEWVNATLQLQLTRIEQLGAGNVYCHLLDAAFPAKVPLHRVKWQAHLEIDFIFNFKILQSCFEHLGIPRHIEVLPSPRRCRRWSGPSARTISNSSSG